VKGVVDPEAFLEDVQENMDLMRYQMFLNSSDKPDQLRELNFAYFGLGSTSTAAMLTGKGKLANYQTIHGLTIEVGRLIYHFGFDWLAIRTGRVEPDPGFKKLNTRKVCYL
jgi:hypothetical protein